MPRPWSKYSEGSSAHERVYGSENKTSEFAVEETEAFREQQRKKEEHVNKLKADENDPKLKEFLEVMGSRTKSKTWGNDDAAPTTDGNLPAEATITSLADSDDDLYEDLPAKKPKDDEDEIMEDIEEKENDMDSDSKPMAGGSAQTESGSTEVPKEPASIKEQIEDTGRLFVRNLSYSCTEEDLKALFSKYGTLSEVIGKKKEL